MATHYSNIPQIPAQAAPSADWVAHEANPASSTPSTSLKQDMAYVGAVEWGQQPSLPLPPAVVKPHRRRLFWWAVRYAFVFLIIFVALLIPILIFRKDADVDDDATIEDVRAKQYGNLVFYICLWLEITWVFAIFFDIVGLALPYLFRFIARYVNSAHQRYWRVFKFMRRPICFLGTTIITFGIFTAFVYDNPLLFVNIDKDPNSEEWAWDDVIDDILEQLTLWMAFYFIEKMAISYIAVHYHYRRTSTTLERAKNIQKALITLYEASIYLHPVNSGTFVDEDAIIRNSKGDMQASNRVRISSYLARLGLDGYKFTSLFGNLISDAPDAHWLRPGSSYATIERAWANPQAAEALARRIWLSLVPRGKYGLTESDIAEVLGLDRAAEVKSIFKTLDEDDRGDIPLDDFVGMVKDAGKKKHNVFRTIIDMDHCINTLDWLCLLIIAAVMIFFIMLLYVPAIKTIQSVLSSLAIGLSFAIGRTLNHLLTGIIFVFFDHPFDFGDVVRLCDGKMTDGIVCTVKRQSILYTVFRRLDNNSDLQISNEELFRKSIENYTRSEINKQRITLFIDFRTSFKDIEKLQKMLEAFMSDNSRDYAPGLALSVTSLHELNKMELRIVFTHRNNWSDERLRAMRSNKFYCNLVAACRQIPLFKPGALLPVPGEMGNPLYTAQLNPSEVSENIEKEKVRRQGLRWDDEKKEIGGQSGNASEEEAAKIEAAKKEAAIAKAEQEAFRRVSKSNPAKQQTALSTAVDIPGSTTGFRLAAMYREEA
ncbi:serine threonine kinase [Trichoderma arundinaceum]|uniref:Serine threonine kinase n=1 Tax=Trichoderma arundinaceum TaxID=490622 RepID=A0A395NZU3_TRIAR|nr:serine threonine kinase [Trichoderma arundinaceum]